MTKINNIDSINLVKASAWAAHHEYLREMKRKPEERKTSTTKETEEKKK